VSNDDERDTAEATPEEDLEELEERYGAPPFPRPNDAKYAVAEHGDHGWLYVTESGDLLADVRGREMADLFVDALRRRDDGRRSGDAKTSGAGGGTDLREGAASTGSQVGVSPVKQSQPDEAASPTTAKVTAPGRDNPNTTPVRGPEEAGTFTPPGPCPYQYFGTGDIFYSCKLRAGHIGMHEAPCGMAWSPSMTMAPVRDTAEAKALGTWVCRKCGTEWKGKPPTECPKCPSEDRPNEGPLGAAIGRLEQALDRLKAETVRSLVAEIAHAEVHEAITILEDVRDRRERVPPINAEFSDAMRKMAGELVVLRKVAEAARAYVDVPSGQGDEPEFDALCDAVFGLSSGSAESPLFELEAILDEIVQRWEGHWADFDEDAFSAAITRLKLVRASAKATAKENK
jgi:hypothetical protein